jgi:16S rRNA (adenine1518-N6/adenine1519-N6)-dimethyltransferase
MLIAHACFFSQRTPKQDAMPQSNQTLTFLQQRLAAAGIRPKRQHGQNFLIDLNLLRLLVESARIDSRDVVLEIGAGTGALTGLLAAVAAAVISVEVDPQLARLASEQLAGFNNVVLLNVDALRGKNRMNPLVMDAVRKALASRPDSRFKLVANLPYSVATPVITNLLSEEPIPCSLTVTVQKEVADRLRARPGSKDYGALSIWVQSQCRVKLLRLLPATVFWPRPKVTSAMVQITFMPHWRAGIGNVEFFHHFARAMFLHRRKLLRGVLLSSYKQLGKHDADQILSELGLRSDSRAEQLDIDQFIDLAKRVTAKCAAPRRRTPSP